MSSLSLDNLNRTVRGKEIQLGHFLRVGKEKRKEVQAQMTDKFFKIFF